MPRGEESDRGAGGGSGGEASGGASQSRSSHSGVDRGSVGRGRAGAGVGGRGLVAGASAAGMEQSPVRPAGSGVLLDTPSHSRGTAAAAGGSDGSRNWSGRHWAPPRCRLSEPSLLEQASGGSESKSI